MIFKIAFSALGKLKCKTSKYIKLEGQLGGREFRLSN